MRVAVLLKHKGDRRWKTPDVGRVPESMLQKILSDDPDLIEFDDERRPLVMTHEFSVSFGFVDLVGVGATGSITIGECKKHDNTEIKRTVIGQLFAYAAAIWGMTYDEFDAIWQAKLRPPMTDDATWEGRKRPPLADEIGKAAEERGLPFDEALFRASVAENLLNGTFTLLLAVDEITPELQRIIEYLSGHMKPGVDVTALELGYVTLGDVEVLVPKTYGVEIAQQKASGSGVPVAPDEATFLGEVVRSTGTWIEPMIRGLLDWAQASGLLVWYGSGSKLGTLNVGLLDPAGRRRPLVACWTSGYVEFEFHQLKYFEPFVSREARVEVLRSLAGLEGSVRAEKQADGWPQVKLQDLRAPGKFTEFTNLLDGIVSEIRRFEAKDAGDGPPGSSIPA